MKKKFAIENFKKKEGDDEGEKEEDTRSRASEGFTDELESRGESLMMNRNRLIALSISSSENVRGSEDPSTIVCASSIRLDD